MATSTPRSQKTAIVTGAAQGMGRAIALRLSRDGFDVCINDIPGKKDALEEVARSIRENGRCHVATADVSSRTAVEKVVQESVAALGPLNVFVANAGIGQVKPVLDLTEDDVRRTFEINTFGVFNCYTSAAKQFIAQGTPGKIIGASSIQAYKVLPLLAHYCASKHAVRGLTQAFALELAPHKITVNAYAPGIVGTGMLDQIEIEIKKIKGIAGAEVRKAWTDQVPLGRLATPEDQANIVSFLAGPDSDYLTGQNIICDGGIVMN
ncbi:uncharacterized protein Z520_12236 [Fonsecaea multimorphosa CBS 102226]|uniref:Diacetyl reductase [(S)-acetoin forming] n=1 Tax=Fonsecaea multimorphosa CBS 102226 TaxID=1442371 RepID=A0A0D2JFZ7_9EURO|nr:uncharacterized protein Z520_12236 [Fonsecaea multimorphosa CBS 102226]KIX92082.1 hypothetical protein Z520_12236 [Fonsecaea multimorphosa CBS 102226]OAL17448.1 hypothetical protein AYO22_11671 [Fonsecaea multimorphosa]